MEGHHLVKAFPLAITGDDKFNIHKLKPKNRETSYTPAGFSKTMTLLLFLENWKKRIQVYPRPFVLIQGTVTGT